MSAFDPDPQVLSTPGRPLGELVAPWANSLTTAAVVSAGLRLDAGICVRSRGLPDTPRARVVLHDLTSGDALSNGLEGGT